MKKNENEIDCIKRGFLNHFNNSKKLQLYKKDITEKIKELMEDSDLPLALQTASKPPNKPSTLKSPPANQIFTLQLSDIDCYKVLAQTKLELNRLRISKKDNLSSIKLLEKRCTNLSTTVEKQDSIIKKLEKSATDIDQKFQNSETNFHQITQENQEFKSSIQTLRNNISILRDELEKEKLKTLHAQQQNEDIKVRMDQVREDFDCYLHGLWHKILTCDILNVEQLDKISKLNEDLSELQPQAHESSQSITIVANNSTSFSEALTITPDRVQQQGQGDNNKSHSNSQLNTSNEQVLRNQIKLGLGDIITKAQLFENRLIETNRQLEEANRKNTSSKKQHGKNLNKIENHLKKQEENFNEMTKNLEAKYGNLVKELTLKNKSSDQQVTQLEMAYAAASTELAKVQNMFNFEKIQNNDLKSTIKNFNIALQLSLGCLVGLISTNSNLVNERALYLKNLKMLETSHNYILKLESAFKDNHLKLTDLHVIFKFRKAVLVVIAANRLKKLEKERSNNKKITSNPIDISRAMTVFTLQLNDEIKFDENLVKLVDSSVSSTQSKGQVVSQNLHKNFNQTLNSIDSGNLEYLVRNFMKLVARSGQNNKNGQPGHKNNSNAATSPLAFHHNKFLHLRLNTGLFTLIKRKNLEKSVKNISSLTFATTNLQRWVVAMSDQMSSIEQERNELRKTELSLREEIIKQRHKIETQ